MVEERRGCGMGSMAELPNWASRKRRRRERRVVGERFAGGVWGRGLVLVVPFEAGGVGWEWWECLEDSKSGEKWC